MGSGPRVLRPDRRQPVWDVVDLDSQLPEDHRARVVWGFVEGLDVTPLERNIKARDSQAGRPTPDRRLYVALWLYATLDEVVTARELDELCRMHSAYRWLCGGVPVNYHDLSDFRNEAGEFLDQLLTRSAAAMVSQGLVSLDCIAVDGVRVQASAGKRSFRRGATLEALYQAAQAKLAALHGELAGDSSAGRRRRQARRLSAAADLEKRLAAAHEEAAKIEAARRLEAKQQRRKEVKHKEVRASTTDPQARVISMARGGFAPAYNLQIKTDPRSHLIIGIAVTNNASDSGQITPALDEIERRYGRRPSRVLADGGYRSNAEIERLSRPESGAVEVYCPLPRPRKNAAAPKRPRRHGPGVTAWLERMGTEAGMSLYRQRFATERPHAHMRNCGLNRLLVRGIEKVTATALWHATAYNFRQIGFLQRRAALQLGAAAT